jgi:hypothetical protein
MTMPCHSRSSSSINIGSTRHHKAATHCNDDAASITKHRSVPCNVIRATTTTSATQLHTNSRQCKSSCCRCVALLRVCLCIADNQVWCCAVCACTTVSTPLRELCNRPRSDLENICLKGRKQDGRETRLAWQVHREKLANQHLRRAR